MNNKIFLVGVLNKEWSTNVSQARAFKRAGYEVVPINYRSIIERRGYKFFEKMLVETVEKHKPFLVFFSKCNGISPDLVSACRQYSITWLWNMDSIQTIKQCPEVLEHARRAHFSSCTGDGTTEWFREQGVKNCITIFDGLDQDVFKPMKPEKEYEADISFIGSKTEDRDKAKKYLEEAGLKVKFYGPGYGESKLSEEFAKVCSSSRMMLSMNTYNDIPRYFSNRLLRYMGCGSYILHYDPTKTLKEVFSEDVIYFSDLEYLKKVSVPSAEEAKEKGDKARQYALDNYTWDNTIQTVLKTIAENPIEKKVAINYHHGLGDIIAVTPQLKYFHENGYIVDLLCRQEVVNSHILDLCPYINSITVRPNPWRGKEGLRSSEEFKKVIEENRSYLENLGGYDLKIDANHLNIRQDIPKVIWNSKECGIQEKIDLKKEIFIPQEIFEKVQKEVQERFPNGYAFVHNYSEFHNEHSFNVTDEMLGGLPEFNTNKEDLHEDINYAFSWLYFAKKVLVSSSVMAVAAEAAGKFIDVLHMGKLDLKVLPHPQLLGDLYIAGQKVDKDEIYEKLAISFSGSSESCILCGRALDQVYHKDLYRCSNCGLLSKTPKPKKSDLKDALKEFMLSACTDSKKEKRRIGKAEKQLSYLKSWLSKAGKEGAVSVYDIGAGPGMFLKAAKDLGWEVYGNELSRVQIEFAKDRYGIELDYGYFEDIDAPESLDVINIWNTLEHLTDPIAVLKKAHSLLTEKGLIHIRVPVKTEEQIKEKYEHFHMYEFTEETIQTMLQACMFTVIDGQRNEDTTIDILAIKPEDKQVLITGCGRSGTNWLTEIVRASGQYKFTDQIEDRGLFGKNKLPYRYGTKLATENKGFTSNALIKLMKENPKLQVLFSVRHPIDNAVAKIKRGQPSSKGGDGSDQLAPDATVDGATKAIKHMQKIYDDVSAEFGDRINFVRLEDMINDPYQATKDVAEFLQIPINAQMLTGNRNNRNEHHKQRYGNFIDRSQLKVRSDTDVDDKLLETFTTDDHFGYVDYNKDYHKPPIIHDYRIKFLSYYLEQQHSTMLDVSCGKTNFARYFRWKGMDVTCTEADDKLVTQAKQMGFDCEKVDLENETLPFKDDNFDVVLCSEVIEHIKNPKEVIKELYRVTSDLVLITTPVGKSYNAPDHVNHWNNLDEIRSIIEGYEAFDIEVFVTKPEDTLQGQRCFLVAIWKV